MDEFDFREVRIQYADGGEADVTVVVGDGNTIFDDQFEYDYKVFYYFHDEAEFVKAHTAVDWDEWANFKVLGYSE